MTLSAVALFLLLTAVPIWGFALQQAIRRSGFGILILSTEYFYFLGLLISPILLVSGAVRAVRPSDFYLEVYGGMLTLSAVHIWLYAVGCCVGWYVPVLVKPCERIILSARRNFVWEQRNAFVVAMVSSVVCSACYIGLVGIDFAFISVASARIGDFSQFGENTRYLFLKRLAEASLLGVVFLPCVMRANRMRWWCWILLVTAVLGVYVNSAARAIFVEFLLVPVAFNIATRGWNVRRAFLLCVLGPVLVLVYYYGKTVLPAIGLTVWKGEAFILPGGAEWRGIVEDFLAHFTHLALSVDAGIRHFLESGVYIPRDVILSPLGIAPSSWFEQLGLERLSYHFVDERFITVNTVFFGEPDSSIPPYYPGASAYLLPLAGGFFFGFIRYTFYSSLEKVWLRDGGDARGRWIIYAMYFIANYAMLFIPSTISLAAFLTILVLCMLFVSAAVKRKS